MLRKVLMLLSFCVLFTIGAFAQGDSDKSKANDTKTSASESSTKPAAFRPTKDQIKKGQEILIREKLWNGEATGVYGDCRPAISAYQKQNGLTQNGKFDKPTLAKMGIPLTDKQRGVESSDPKSSKSSSSSSEAKHTPPFRATDDQIKALQTKLKEAKLFAGEVNGERSEELKESIRKFQDKNGLKVTGTINAVTLEKAGVALTDKQKAAASGDKSSDKGKED